MNPFDILLISTLLLSAFVLCQLAVKRKGGLHFTASRKDTGRRFNIALHLAGILLMGLLPWKLFHKMPFLTDQLFTTPPTAPMIFTTFILSIAAALLALREAKKMDALANLNSMPAPHYIYTYLPIRIVYIASYEYFFRGILLFSSLQLMNAFWAILLNTGFYLLAHILGDKKEVLGTLLLGPLLCAACMIASSFWPAVVVHLFLTLFYEISYLRISYKRINYNA